MEFLEGCTLMQAVSVHKFTEPQIAYIAKYLLRGILFLHENQIAHRDLKSSNIVLTLSGSVKLIDLGLCTDVSQGPVTHMVGSVRHHTHPTSLQTCAREQFFGSMTETDLPHA